LGEKVVDRDSGGKKEEDKKGKVRGTGLYVFHCFCVVDLRRKKKAFFSLCDSKSP